MTIRIVLALLCALFWASEAGAQQLQRVTNCGDGSPGPNSPGYQDATGKACVTGTVTTTPPATTPVAGAQYGLAVTSATTLTVPATTKVANVVVEGQNVRCTTDGATTPTASVGSLYSVGQILTAWGTSLTNLKCIQVAASATLDIEYFK